ncbi:MAG: HypC/HybG/HupF family hydrogenase formation chaperone [Anaerolineales bacterium]|jgi:hydrogenase expression/formation protein HypC
MCLGVPGKVIELYDAGGIKMAKVDFGGVVREACLEVVPEVEIGQYVIIHVGFAISVLDEDEAQKSLALLQELYETDNLIEIDPDPELNP